MMATRADSGKRADKPLQYVTAFRTRKALRERVRKVEK